MKEYIHIYIYICRENVSIRLRLRLRLPSMRKICEIDVGLESDSGFFTIYLSDSVYVVGFVTATRFKTRHPKVHFVVVSVVEISL